MVHGIDDFRGNVIKSLAGDNTSLKSSLSLIPGTGGDYEYASGFMFLRYLAKQGSEHWSSSGNSYGNKVALNDISQSDAVTIKGNLLTIGKDFVNEMLDLSSYSSIKKVDASALTRGVMIIDNRNADSILAGIGNDTISGNNGDDTIIGGSGDDIIYGDEGNDIIEGGTGNDSIGGGTGNDTLTGGSGKDVFIYATGSDVIKDYNAGEDKIKLIEEFASVTSSSLSGNNVILAIGDRGSITVENAMNKKISIIDGNGNETSKVYGNDTPPVDSSTFKVTKSPVTLGASYTNADASSMKKAVKVTGNAKANSILGGSSKDTLYGADGNDTLNGDLGNDKLYGQNGNDTLWGGEGNDTLTGGNGNDLFIYTSGNDVISDYAAGDKISLGAAISKSSIKGSDAVFTIGKNTLTVKKAKGKQITLVDSSGTEQTIIGGAFPVDDNTKSNLTIDAKATMVDATARTTDITISGNKLANTIFGGKGNDSINGGAGNDKLYGNDGNDTLVGGSGNDSLWGDAGADTFLYSKGDGKDVIFGFDDSDLLQITGTFSGSYNKSKNTIAFKVGSTANAITLKDFTATTFNVNGNAYIIDSSSKFVKK